MKILEHYSTTQIIKASKPPMNRYAKTEMLLHIKMPKNEYITTLDGAVLLEMYNKIELQMDGSKSAGSKDLSSQINFQEKPKSIS